MGVLWVGFFVVESKLCRQNPSLLVSGSLTLPVVFGVHMCDLYTRMVSAKRTTKFQGTAVLFLRVDGRVNVVVEERGPNNRSSSLNG
jgi:hypothetical protein